MANEFVARKGIIASGSVYVVGSLTAVDASIASITGSFKGDGAQITGITSTLPSGLISSSLQFNSLVSPFTGSYTGSLTGPATVAISSSYALSASYAPGGDSGGDPFPYTGTAIISGSLYVSGSTFSISYDTLSDRNQKDNIILIQDALTLVNKLEGVRFTWKGTQQPSLGLIAQDVAEVIPDLVTQNDFGNVMNYNGVIGVLVEAVKSLTRRVEELEK